MAAGAAEDRRYRVRPDAFYVRSADGVWLRNNLGSFSIQGAGAYRLVASLFDNLTADRPLGAITAGLPEGARSSILRLVDVLRRNGFIAEVTYPLEVVPDWIAERYAAHLAYLDQHGDRPVARLMRVRARQVAVIGSGVALRALLSALGDFGIAKAVVVTTDRSAAAVADVVRAASRRDPRLRWRTVVQPGSLDVPAAAELPEVADAAQVLIASDDDAASLAAPHRSLRADGRPVGVLARCGDFILSVPPGTSPAWCLECVHRCVAGAVHGDAADLPPALTPAVIAALNLVQHTFAQLAEVPFEEPERVTLVEPLAPVVRTHTGRRHPNCTGHGAAAAARPVHDLRALPGEPVRPDVPTSYDAPQTVAVSDRIVTVTAAWTDQVMGPLLALGEGDADQLPLSASRCRIADPASTSAAPVTRRFTCRALSPREARNQVVLHALEWLTGRIRAVGEDAGDARPWGYGAGWTAAEALYRALLAASAGLTAGWSDWTAVTDDGAGDDPVRRFLTETLRRAGRPWTGTATASLPTGLIRAGVRTGDGSEAVGLGLDEAHATNNALLAAVAAATSAGDESALLAHLAPPVPTWPAAVSGVLARSSAARSGAIATVDVTDAAGFPGSGYQVFGVRLTGEHP